MKSARIKKICIRVECKHNPNNCPKSCDPVMDIFLEELRYGKEGEL